MKIKVFIITFNEADIIAFTVKHYQQFCSEIHIYDNYSTDKTREIAVGLGCIVHTFGTEGVLDDRAYLEVKNNCWKDHRDSDYIIVCDADEVLDYKARDNRRYFITPDKPTIIQGVGYDIYSETLPINSWDEKRIGYENSMYNKAIMFRPDEVESINYGYGCHGAKPKMRRGPAEVARCPLYHMRYVGGFERLANRYDTYKKRMCDFNKVNGLGHQYLKSIEDLAKEWEEIKIKSKEI